MFIPINSCPVLRKRIPIFFGKGDHHFIYEKLGAHICEIDGTTGVSFAVWAPSAKRVSVVGDFNFWDGRKHMMRVLGSSGVWEIFIPGVSAGRNYKYEIYSNDGRLLLKSDPYAFRFQLRPDNASQIFFPDHKWKDKEYMDSRPEHTLDQPMSIYEVHLFFLAEKRRLGMV
ncbi:MAG: hypothetical protein U5N56_05495 [Candidatus Marinimicrobia bacterium]|nr:hypothetical protein [Candidatus Neomarinimicrobiota bacterium]